MTINTVTSTVGDVKKLLLEQCKDDVLRHMAVWIHGAPGVGKSEIMKQVAEEMNYMLIDLRLTRMDTTDLTGLPYLDPDTKQTIFYLPEFLPTEEKIAEAGFDGALIFLDEISSAEPRLQVSAYELVLDRTVGNYKAPDNCFIVAAGNRVEDGAIAYEMTSAISDRLIHYVVDAVPQDWLEWAKENGINVEVLTFIETKPDFLTNGFEKMLDGRQDSDNKIIPSPRSWTRVSQVLDAVEDPKLRRAIIPGIIGQSTAIEFFHTVEEIGQLAPMSEYIRLAQAKDIKGLKKILPTGIPGLYGLGYSLPAYCSKEEDFIAATFVFNIMTEINDGLPRNEILSVAMIALFKKSQSTGKANIIRKITKSDAYRKMRKTTQEFAEIENI